MLALKPLLQQHGISQAELARLVELSPATIAQWINHEQWPKTPSANELKQRVVVVLAPLGIAATESVFEPVPTAATAGTEIETAVSGDTQQQLSEEDDEMILRKQRLTREAQAHFGLSADPFTSDINSPDDVYLTPPARAVREHLWATARHGGFMAVVGESGAGKSTLREDFEERIIRESAPIILMSPYVLGMEDSDQNGKPLKAAAIIDSMIRGIAPLENPKRTMEAKSAQLHRLLRDSRRAQNTHVLIIEEAHGLHKQTLKHLKRFIELKDGMRPLLSIVLIGQTELKKKLSPAAADVREVVQRCELHELPPLNADLEPYLRFKFGRIGAAVDAIFEPGAMDAIRARLMKAATRDREAVNMTYPLMINNLVTAAMNEVAVLGLEKISADQFKEV